MKEYKIDVGLTAPTIKEQLENQNVSMKDNDYEKYEKIRNAIHMLAFHICTTSETEKNWDRFNSKLEKAVFMKD